MDLRSLQYFADVAKYHNFTKAAQQNFISQPALSKKISQLEQEVGAPLFNRNTHSVSLTKAGVIFNEAAKSIIITYQQASNKIQQLNDPSQSQLRVITDIDQEHISPYINRLASYRNKFPNINISLQQDRTVNVQDKVRQGKADLGITSVEDVDGLEWFGLQEDEMVLVGNQNIMKRFPSPVDLDLITDVPFLKCLYLNIPFIDQISSNKGVTVQRVDNFENLINKLKLQSAVSILLLKSVRDISQLSWLPINIDDQLKTIKYGWCIRKDNQKEELQLFRQFIHNFFS